MSISVEHWNEGDDGPLTEAAMREKLERRGYRVTTYHYPPGTIFPEHHHGVEKIDGVLAGRFRLSMAGESIVLEAGDMIAVPSGMMHSAEVVGSETVVSLDAVKSG